MIERPSVAPIPELYIRWRDPETNRVVKMDRVDHLPVLPLEVWAHRPQGARA